ncbi:MAG: GntR family transcriptional regulator [Mesorhizobium sp.]|uniref:GntR family transcriptional regulator n=1 Tax=Mesorhizobium sp. TaxID=1871066 RepID=UPI000FE4FB40|nr:GntR family transcriptional regulator [Mesorhizobium sp.]RWA98694.1 MAG: GntR family transcriptional regulator [Mesorhizobium sp.]RWB10996.1 MAG: GntR family transcriptional regulator [Mesorhizobium sp.]
MIVVSLSSELKPLDKTPTLADRAYLSLRHALTSGHFAPGEKLTIRDVAAMLDISMTPAKEAVSRLIAEKILRAGTQRSAMVPRLNTHEVRDLYLARISLEASITEEAVKRLTEKQILQLEAIQGEMETASAERDYKLLLRENERFHLTIYEAAGMPETFDIIRGLWMRLGPHLNIIFSSQSPTRSFPAHIRLLKAIRARDPLEAGAAVRDDLRLGAERMCQMLVDAEKEESTAQAGRSRMPQ